jgi:Arc/MetJ-type ribon-helix-helix transcriptional regulator
MPKVGKRGLENMKMVRITLRLPKQHIEIIDALVNIGEYTSRSDVIRSAIRNLIYEQSDKLLEGIEKVEKLKRLTDTVNKLAQYTKK